MLPIIGLIIALLSGAVLFFFAGYLWSRVKQGRAPPGLPPPTAAPADAELQRRLQELTLELQAARSREGDLQRQVAFVRQQEGALHGQLDELLRRDAEQKLELTRREQAAMELEQQAEAARAQRSRLAREVGTLRAQLETAAAERERLSRAGAPARPLRPPAPAEEDDFDEKTRVQADMGFQVALQLSEADRQALEEQKAQLESQLTIAARERESLRIEVDRMGRLLDKARKDAAAGAPAPAGQPADSDGGVQQELADLRQRLAKARKAMALIPKLMAQLEEYKKQLSAAEQQEAERQRLVLELERSREELVKVQQEAAKLPGLQGELEQARQALGAAEQGVEQREDLAHKLAEAERRDQERRSAEQQRQQEREAAEQQRQQELSDLKVQLAAVDGKLIRLETLEEERLQLRDRVEQLTRELARLSDLEQVERDHKDLQMELQTMRLRQQETDSLRQEKDLMTLKLRDAEQEQRALSEEVGQLRTADQRRQDLAIRVVLQGEQLQQLEALRQENATLRQTSAELEDLRARAAALESECAALRAMGLARRAPQPPDPGAAARPGAPAEGLGGALELLLQPVLQRPGVRGAVLADASGLVVAGSGSLAEPLAAAAAIFAADARRVLGQVLPLGAFQQVTVQDDNALCITARPCASPSGDELILATLTVSEDPPADG